MLLTVFALAALQSASASPHQHEKHALRTHNWKSASSMRFQKKGSGPGEADAAEDESEEEASIEEDVAAENWANKMVTKSNGCDNRL